MKKVTLFVAAMFLTTVAFSQKLVKTETTQGTKYVEENVDLGLMVKIHDIFSQNCSNGQNS